MSKFKAWWNKLWGKATSTPNNQKATSRSAFSGTTTVPRPPSPAPRTSAATPRWLAEDSVIVVPDDTPPIFVPSVVPVPTIEIVPDTYVPESVASYEPARVEAPSVPEYAPTNYESAPSHYDSAPTHYDSSPSHYDSGGGSYDSGGGSYDSGGSCDSGGGGGCD